MFQLRFQAQQGIGQEEVQVLLTDLLKGVGLYFDRRNLINIFGMVRKENTAAEAVRQGVVLVGIDDDGVWEADCYLFRGGIRRYRVLQGKVKIIGDHAYMTGILPIKKYGSHSALNMFFEYSMTDQKELEEYTGFTEDEVREL